MKKNNLKGKYIVYFDEDSKQRTEKVVKITGQTLTVKNAVGRHKRINPNWLTRNNRKRFIINGVLVRKKIETIEWK